MNNIRISRTKRRKLICEIGYNDKKYNLKSFKVIGIDNNLNKQKIIYLDKKL